MNQSDSLKRAARQWLSAEDKTARATIQTNVLPVDFVARMLKSERLFATAERRVGAPGQRRVTTQQLSRVNPWARFRH